MKRLLVLTVALVPFGIATGAWAEPIPATSGALSLGDHQVGTETMVMQDSDRMITVTNQVNGEESAEAVQATPAPAQRQEPRTPILPEGMVVRSSQFGGVSVGVEF